MYEDKTLVCKDCGAEFVFTAGEQEFYAEKGFVNEPKRCKSCRDAKKNASGNKPEREMFTATCAACGKEARVPFQPREDPAAKRRRFPSVPVRTVLFIAASALQR